MVRQRWGKVVQPSGSRLQNDAKGAAAAWQAAFRKDQIPSGKSRYIVSRGRNANANPLTALVRVFRDAQADGRDIEPALHLLAYLERMAVEIWPDADGCMFEAMRQEQLADGEEDVVQIRAMHDHAAIPAWIEAGDRHVARVRKAQVIAHAEYRRKVGS
jgi:hypothetical protein